MHDPLPAQTAPTTLPGAYQGEAGALFKLALRTGFLTLITMGIYRFWAKTRIRRYMWSATAPGGVPFEYTGTGLEKFLGFLIAIVVLALYLGLMQMGLFLLGLSVFSGGTDEQAIAAQIGASYLTVLALLPMLFFARYRGRRYLLSRTRWRGIRFGAEPGAWGYMWRGLGYTLLSAVSLGLLLPLQMFRLEKYMADRTYFGSARLTQGGTWTMLYAPMKHILFGGLLLVAGAVVGSILESPVAAGVGAIVGYIWLMIGIVYFSVHSFNRLTANKRFEGGIGFTAAARTGSVLRIFILGGLATAGISILFLIPFVLVIFGIAVSADGWETSGPEVLGDSRIQLLLVIGVAAYLLFFVAIAASVLVFITQPLLRHYIEQVTVLNAPAIAAIRQRAGDDIADAEGFADALDIGGGF